jgi:hypothetical protein
LAFGLGDFEDFLQSQDKAEYNHRRQEDAGCKGLDRFNFGKHQMRLDGRWRPDN